MARADPAGPARSSVAGRVALVAGGAGTGTELVFSCAGNANHSLHNIQTLRGVRTRDARNFARYLDETLERWGDEAEVHWGPHTWPVWGNENIAAFIGSQRDTYKYIHDQALRLANKGYTPLEAAEVIEAADYRWQLRSCTSWSSPSRATPRRRAFRLMRMSRWATRLKARNGAASS